MLDAIEEAFALYKSLCRDPDDILLERFTRTLVADNGSVANVSAWGHKYLQDAREDYESFRKYLSFLKYYQHEQMQQALPHWLSHGAVYMRNLFQLWKHRSFFVTDSGRIGLCSLSCKPGDIVCIFLSLNHTYVVRHVPEKSSVKLICSAYTDGVMYGEALGERDPARDEIFIID